MTKYLLRFLNDDAEQVIPDFPCKGLKEAKALAFKVSGSLDELKKIHPSILIHRQVTVIDVVKVKFDGDEIIESTYTTVWVP